MSHIHLTIDPETPNEKLIVLAKYCLARAGVTTPEIALQKASGTIKRRLRQEIAPDVTFPDAALESLWQHVAPWGTHWWVQAAPILDAMLARDANTTDDHNAWGRIAHLLYLAGDMFVAHLTGIAPNWDHPDMAFFDDESLLPSQAHNVIAQAARIGIDNHHRDSVDRAQDSYLTKAVGVSQAMSAAEEAAIRYAQRSAGALLQPLVSNVQARIANRLVHQERQALRRLVPQAIRQRQHPRTLARLLAEDVGNWQRDWERVARTEINNAMHHGQVEAMIAHHPSNSVLLPDGSTAPSANPSTPTIMVFRFPAATACDHCLRLFTKSDGTPRLYPLADVLASPPNYGVPAAQWTIQIGSVHPNCVCAPWLEYTPMHASLFQTMRRP